MPTAIHRCAIYTRVSSEERLGQGFNSLHAQREAGEAYIASQRIEGWTPVGERYDDGGFSGGTLERPGLSRLLSDIRSGLIDVVVVYKVDRLTRSLADFAQLVSVFEAHGVSFVSVTQAFNTTSSMGRLTLNVLLSFAQFEREVTAERIRDKFAASRARGLWTGGPAPLGYRVEEGRLVIDPDGAALVRRMYALYARLGSAQAVADALTADGALTHRGRPLGARYVLRKLTNRLYLGELVHRGRSLPGQHEAIVSPRLWAQAQAALARTRPPVRRRPPVPALLRGLVYDASGRPLVHHFTTQKGRLYRYYVASPRRGHDSSGRYRAEALEDEVLGQVAQIASVPSLPAERDNMVRRLVERVEVGAGRVTLKLNVGGEATCALTAEGSAL